MKIFNLPDLGEGLPDAEIREWLVNEGDEVKEDQPIVSMETAKALVDVPSPYAGRITKFHGKPGDIIKTGNPLVEFEQDANEVAKQSSDAGTVVGNIEVGQTILKESPIGIEPRTNLQANIKASPAVRSLAKQLNVDLDKVTPTGPGGSITAQDIKNAGNHTRPIDKDYEELHGPRRAMAINMAMAHQAVVPVTLMDDADIHHFSSNEDITFRLIQAMITACLTEPALNAHFNGKNLSRCLFTSVNIGLAVDTAKGLYVPVLKEAQTLSKEKIREEINKFKQQAEKQEFAKDTLQGASITLSNFGVFVGKYANPIVVPPTVAIVAVGKLREQAVAVAGKVEIHRIVPISLTFDHRAITGGEAARFLAAFIKSLEA